MKKIFVVFLLMLLASCGFSTGDDVVIVPNDSPDRSVSWQGSFEKADGDNAVINRNGKLITVPLNEVFYSQDEEVQHLIKARKDFYAVFRSNMNQLNQESIRSLVIDKANQASLNDWVAYLELMPQIDEFNKLVKNSNASVNDLNEAWNDLFDSFSDLEDEIATLSNPKGNNRLNFKELIFQQLNLSVTDAIRNSYGSSQETNISGWSEALAKAFKLVPLRVEEERHAALLLGKTMTDKGLEKAHVTAINKILSDTFPKSIQLASAELKENTTSVALANLLVDQLHYPKVALAQFHDKKTWDEFLAAAAEVDIWAGVLTLDHWRGSIKINRQYGAAIHNDVVLKVFYNNSLLKPVAELLQSRNQVLKGVVTKSTFGVQIKDKLGNWNWEGVFDDEGAFVVSGRYPANYRVYKINTKLRSPIAIKKLQEARLAEAKRLEVERLAKIEALHQQLKKEQWYGVPFSTFGNQWAANPVLISLDFNQNQYTIRDFGGESEQRVSTTFDYDLDENGKGQLSDVKGVKTSIWNSGDTWRVSFDSKNNKLYLNINNRGNEILTSKVNWKIQLVPKSVYMKRLNNLTNLSHSTWSSGGIHPNGASLGRWVSKLQLNKASVVDDVVKIKGKYSFDVTTTDVTFIAVPALEKGMVLATLNLTKKNIELGWQQLKYGAASTEDISESKLVLRDWKNKWAFVKTSASKVVAEPVSKPVEVKKLTSIAPVAVTEPVIKKEKLASKEKVVTHKVVKPSNKPSNNSSLSSSDSKMLNQAIKSLEVLL